MFLLWLSVVGCAKLLQVVAPVMLKLHDKGLGECRHHQLPTTPLPRNQLFFYFLYIQSIQTGSLRVGFVYFVIFKFKSFSC